MQFPTYSDYATHDESQFPELWEGCVAAWAPCLGATGLRLFDTSKRQGWGTLTNMDPPTDWVVSGGQTALDFDGVDDFVNCGSSDTHLQLSMTVAFWMRHKGTPTTFQSAIGKTSSGNWDNGFGGYFTSSNAFRLWFGMWNLSPGSTTILPNEWTHIAATLTPNTLTTCLNQNFCNGVASSWSESNVAQSRIDNTLARAARLELASLSGSYFGNLQLDDIRIYNRALTPAEIRLLATRRGIAYQRRKRRYAFNAAPSFLAAWARNSNVLIQPGVA